MAFNQAFNQAYGKQAAGTAYAQQYNKNKIMTATPAELTLFLYEGAIKFCNLALVGLEQNDIIVEFQSTLNRKYPVAEDFNKIYNYIYDLLVEANVKKDKDVLEKALAELRGMRDTWKEIMFKTKNGTEV